MVASMTLRIINRRPINLRVTSERKYSKLIHGIRDRHACAGFSRVFFFILFSVQWTTERGRGTSFEFSMVFNFDVSGANFQPVCSDRKLSGWHYVLIVELSE